MSQPWELTESEIYESWAVGYRLKLANDAQHKLWDWLNATCNEDGHNHPGRRSKRRANCSKCRSRVAGHFNKIYASVEPGNADRPLTTKEYINGIEEAHRNAGESTLHFP